MDKIWKPIPGYEGVYWIDSTGAVKNKDDHMLQPIASKEGAKVELRLNGQREQLLVKELLISVGWC